MKIAVIDPVGGHGGMNYYDFGLCRGLAAAGAEPTLFTCDMTAVEPGMPFKTRLTFNRVWGSGGRLSRGFRYLRGLERSLREACLSGSRIAHFHLFNTTLLELAAIRLANLYGLKPVITVHDVEGFSRNSSRNIAQHIFSASSLLIVHNRVCLDALTGVAPGMESKTVVIPHGNYADYVKQVPREEALRRIGVSGKGPFVLFWGQIKEVKGLDILLNALPVVAAKIPSLRLVIAGKVWKNDFSRYERIIRKYNLQENVIAHVRYIPDDQAHDYFSAADMVVLPYRVIYQSGVLLMAMSYGRPVMVSNLPGMTSIVEDAVTGFVFRDGDPEDLAKRLVRSLSDTEGTAEVARAGNAKVLREYAWNDIGLKTNEAYELVFKNRGR